jgi:hypothetical protein
MLFVCWLWRGTGFAKRTAKYDGRHVAALASMLRRHGGHDLLCVTDDVSEVPHNVKFVEMPDHVKSLQDYLPKLWAWSPEFHRILGSGRFVSIDLDVVITDDFSDVFDAVAPVILWDKASRELYNTSLFCLEVGRHHEVWTRLTADELMRAKARAVYWTGDQSWVSHVLGPGALTFGEESGVMQYRPLQHRITKPEEMKAGFMCGPYSPDEEALYSEWVRKEWR